MGQAQRTLPQDECDLVVVGGGVAGLFGALCAASERDVCLISKGPLLDSASSLAIQSLDTALVKTAEAVVKINRIMGGTFTSKRLYYAPPAADQIEEIRKYYGDVYPSVDGGRPGRASKKRPRRDSGK